MNYSENLAEIERILARFRNEQMSVDELTTEVSRAGKLIAACRAQLLKTEKELAAASENDPASEPDSCSDPGFGSETPAAR